MIINLTESTYIKYGEMEEMKFGEITSHIVNDEFSLVMEYYLLIATDTERISERLANFIKENKIETCNQFMWYDFVNENTNIFTSLKKNIYIIDKYLSDSKHKILYYDTLGSIRDAKYIMSIDQEYRKSPEGKDIDRFVAFDLEPYVTFPDTPIRYLAELISARSKKIYETSVDLEILYERYKPIALFTFGWTPLFEHSFQGGLNRAFLLENLDNGEVLNWQGEDKEIVLTLWDFMRYRGLDSARDLVVKYRIKETNGQKKIYMEYECYHLLALAYLDYYKMLENDIVLLKCENCGRYFVPDSRNDEKYCNNQYGNTGKTCKQVGKDRTHKKKLLDDAVLFEKQSIYNKYYEKHIRRYKGKDMKRKKLNELKANMQPGLDMIRRIEQAREDNDYEKVNQLTSGFYIWADKFRDDNGLERRLIQNGDNN